MTTVVAVSISEWSLVVPFVSSTVEVRKLARSMKIRRREECHTDVI